MRVITKNAFENAFTLAEVLITLAIIGVVAAMTMPTLINNTNGAQFKTAYKKGLSVLSQAVVMNIALDNYDLSETTANDSASDSTISLYKMFKDRTNATLMSDAETTNYKVAVTGDSSLPTAGAAAQTGNYTFKFGDGIVFSFKNDAAACTEAHPCYGWIDVNGIKGPNRSVSCSTTTDKKECTSVVQIDDIYPIKMYDQTIAPASAAARAVLYGSENDPVTSGT